MTRNNNTNVRQSDKLSDLQRSLPRECVYICNAISSASRTDQPVPICQTDIKHTIQSFRLVKIPYIPQSTIFNIRWHVLRTRTKEGITHASLRMGYLRGQSGWSGSLVGNFAFLVGMFDRRMRSHNDLIPCPCIGPIPPCWWQQNRRSVNFNLVSFALNIIWRDDNAPRVWEDSGGKLYSP